MDNNASPPRRKRAKISCRECHRRKQKPCTHCLRRGKRDACLYELDDAYTPFALSSLDSEHHIIDSVPRILSDTSECPKDHVSSLGYASDCKGTSGIIHGLGESVNLWNISHGSDNRIQYTSIIRQLPSRRHVHMLVEFFFENVAWHYDIVDEASFTNRLSQWECLSTHQLKQSPQSLPTALRSFPALLFQVLAQALLFQPAQHDDSLNDLKYADDMDLSDRAAEYSEAGHRLAESFRKSELTLTIVQAELMQTCFEKTTGAVIEAWHTLGAAIRDAQELGIHLVEPDATAYLGSREPSEHESARKIWFLLHLWDAHMAVVLGRPMSTRMNAEDVPPPATRTCDSVTGARPQAYDIILCGYHTAYKYLQAVPELEKMEDCQQAVDSIHDAIITNITNLPTWATTRRSRQGEPPWLSAALETMYTNVQFVLFALHRPFVFAESKSRSRAFHSAMEILESQTRLFDQTPPLQYRAFSLVFATFDAMVLIAAMQIQFPSQFAENIPSTKRNMRWGLERLELLQARNSLASSAFSIMQRLYRRMLTVALPTQSPSRSHEHIGSDELVALGVDMEQVDWDGTLQVDFGDLLPPQPLNDLLCQGPISNVGGLQLGYVGADQANLDFLNEV